MTTKNNNNNTSNSSSSNHSSNNSNNKQGTSYSKGNRSSVTVFRERREQFKDVDKFKEGDWSFDDSGINGKKMDREKSYLLWQNEEMNTAIRRANGKKEEEIEESSSDSEPDFEGSFIRAKRQELSLKFDLPDEILKKVFTYFTPPKLATLQLVQQKWRRVGSDDSLWRYFFQGTTLDELSKNTAYDLLKKCCKFMINHFELYPIFKNVRFI